MLTLALIAIILPALVAAALLMVAGGIAGRTARPYVMTAYQAARARDRPAVTGGERRPSQTDDGGNDQSYNGAGNCHRAPRRLDFGSYVRS